MEEKDTMKEQMEKEQVEKEQPEKEQPEKKDKKDRKALHELKEKCDALTAQVAEKDAALAKEKDDYIRLMAEFENFRRRSAKERLELIETASEKIILDLLPVIDDFERALKALGESEDNSSAKQGTELIYNKLNAVLTSKGLKKIEAVGAEFDVDMMEAVAQFPAADPEQKGKVIDTVQNGYKLGEKVIRYAKVVVAQ